MRLIGDPRLGPFCPFRGIRVKGRLHWWIGSIPLLAALFAIGICVWMLVDGQLPAYDTLALTWQGGRLGPAEGAAGLIVCVLLGVLTGIRIRVVARLAVVVGFGVLSLAPGTFGQVDWRGVLSELPGWLPLEELQHLEIFGGVAAAFGLADLVGTSWSCLRAMKDPEPPRFAPYHRLTGWPRRPARQIPGPLGFLFVAEDEFLGDKVIVLQMGSRSNVISCQKNSGGPSKPVAEGYILQLTHLADRVQIWRTNRHWHRTRLKNRLLAKPGRTVPLMWAWLVNPRSEETGAPLPQPLRPEPVEQWPVLPLTESDRHVYGRSYKSDKARPRVLGMVLHFSADRPFDALEPGVAAIARVENQEVRAESSVPFTGSLNLGPGGERVLQIERPDNAITNEALPQIPLNELSILPLRQKSGALDYLVFTPFQNL